MDVSKLGYLELDDLYTRKLMLDYAAGKITHEQFIKASRSLHVISNYLFQIVANHSEGGSEII